MQQLIDAAIGGPVAMGGTVSLLWFLLLFLRWRTRLNGTRMANTVYAYLLMGVLYYTSTFAWRLAGVQFGDMPETAYITMLSTMLRFSMLAGLTWALMEEQDR